MSAHAYIKQRWVSITAKLSLEHFYCCKFGIVGEHFIATIAVYLRSCVHTWLIQNSTSKSIWNFRMHGMDPEILFRPMKSLDQFFWLKSILCLLIMPLMGGCPKYLIPYQLSKFLVSQSKISCECSNHKLVQIGQSPPLALQDAHSFWWTYLQLSIWKKREKNNNPTRLFSRHHHRIHMWNTSFQAIKQIIPTYPL